MHFFGTAGRASALGPRRIAQQRIQVLCMAADDVKVLHRVTPTDAPWLEQSEAERKFFEMGPKSWMTSSKNSSSRATKTLTGSTRSWSDSSPTQPRANCWTASFAPFTPLREAVAS